MKGPGLYGSSLCGCEDTGHETRESTADNFKVHEHHSTAITSASDNFRQLIPVTL